MPQQDRLPLGPAFLALLLLLLGAGPGGTPPSADAASSVVAPEVRDRVVREGRVRVIAELRLPGGAHVAEGLLSGAAVSVQRGDIASVRHQLLARLATRHHRVLHEYATVPLLALDVGPDALAELEASSVWVRRVVADTVNVPALPQSVPLIGADQAWSRGFDGTGMVVAIIDTGVESTHPFLAGKVVEEACYSSTVSGQSVTLCPNGQSQQTGPGAGVSCSLAGCWHGTHVAGIAAGNGSGAGVTFSGVAKGAQIMAVQVFSRFDNASDCGGSAPCVLAWTSDIIAGLERVYALRGVRNFASANLSLGGGLYTAPCDSDPEKGIIDNLRSAGIATVVVAGNDGSTTSLSAPGCISSAISVGATTKADVVASFSNVAPFLSLFAPGVSITSSVTGGGFGVASGTSMATPHVTGAWAVLKQAAPSATVGQILSALQTTGLLITDTRSGGTVAKPRIRVDQALATLALTVSSVAPNQGAAGATVPVTINGSGFATGANVSAGAGITVSNVSVGSGAQLTATLAISSGAALGIRDVIVTNLGGGSGTLTGGFTVAGGGAKAVLQTPAPGSVLPAGPVTFTWSAGSGVSEYWLDIGTASGGIDLYHQSQGTSLSGTVGGLPTTGQTLYVRLSSLIGGVWQFNDYTYTAFGAPSCTPPTKADMQTPAPGSTLAGATVTFTWSKGCQVAEYWLSVGTTPGGSDLYHHSQGTNLSGTVGGLPTTGQVLYVRLWSRIGGVWQFNDYSYGVFGTACTPSTKADMQTPTPGATLAGATVTFTWSTGCQVTEYWLSVATTPGGTDLLHQSQGTSLSGTVGGLPTTGQTVYVRLWSRIAGVWQFTDYTYTAFGAVACTPPTKANMQTPAPGATLAGATVTFTWSKGCQVAEYWLDVGTTPAGLNLLHQSQGTNLSGTVGGLPTTGQTLYVRLWSRIAGVWQFTDYTYTAFGTATCTPPTKADMQTPAPGATLAGATVTFTWSKGCQVAEYWLDVGTTPAGLNLFHQSQGTNLSGTVGGLPTTGQRLYVRLWSLIGGAWQFNDYTYTAATAVSQSTSLTTMSAVAATLLAVTGSGFDPATDTSVRFSNGQGAGPSATS